MTRAVIFDIDGTLADATHRLHHITDGNRDWDAFFGAMGEDPVIKPIRDLMLVFTNENMSEVVFCSGRPERYRQVTRDWLLRHGLASEYAALYMRPDGDFRADHIIKAELLTRMRTDGYEPWLAIDDRPSIVAMWRENGITCLQCRDWDEAPAATKPGMLTLMVGPSGAGKTRWLSGAVYRTMSFHPTHIVSSDQIRADLCDDFRDQSRNTEVFTALHAIVQTRVTHGLPTVVDATNLRNKDRKAIVALAPFDAPVRYIVIDRPMEEKRRDAGWRPVDLLERHAQTFKSNLKDILAGDGLPNVTIMDLRR